MKPDLSGLPPVYVLEGFPSLPNTQTATPSVSAGSRSSLDRDFWDAGLHGSLALDRGKPFPHTLLLGPPGMGKTSLAEAVAREMGAPIHRVFGTLLAESSQVLPLVASLGKGDVLFIDEIHGMSLAATECLHGALEDGHVDLPLVAGPEARVIRLELEPFTILGATTEPGKLPAPFRARFQEETEPRPLRSAPTHPDRRSAFPRLR